MINNIQQIPFSPKPLIQIKTSVNSPYYLYRKFNCHEKAYSSPTRRTSGTGNVLPTKSAGLPQATARGAAVAIGGG